MLLQAGEVNASVGFDETTKGWAAKAALREEQIAKSIEPRTTSCLPYASPCVWLFALGSMLFPAQPATPLISSRAAGDELDEGSVALAGHLFE